ncbi:diguanylate cyclase [Acidaminobacter sp. JC074]|uniref:sensor domain-containing diguanylate cyclase n=1 Tax=Acidaminobacter sp. JC074 TaxID=2530199 RepID=UPI001F115849|nr:diguanylate cyclase [Acidaminobacter sp. JC074]MCH4886394.1 diguanylate cyclase [Acidaminobacter sp. JC074]
MFKSIKSRIAFGSVMLVLITIIVISVTFFVFESNHLKDIAIDKSLKVNELQAKMMDDYFTKHINELKELSVEVSVKNLDREAILHALLEIDENENYDFFNTFFLEMDGKTETPSGEKTDASDRDFYHQLMSGDFDYIISDPVIGRARQVPAIAILVPVRVEGQLIGAVSGVLLIEELSMIASDANIGDNSYGWLCNQEGLVVAHPSQEHAMKTNLLDTDEMGYKGLEDIWHDSREKDFGFGEYYDGILKENKILTYYDIAVTPGWKLMITTIPEETYADSERLISLLVLVTIPLTVVLAFAASLYARRMVNPLVTLTEKISSSKMSENSLMEDYGSSDEMNTLIQAYNQMRLSINEHTLHLEEMVRERTEELNKLNHLLKDQNDELEAQNDELFNMASTDQLTGLINREHFHEQILKMIGRVNSGLINSFTILFLDLDNFKYYNDTFGHDIGDKILISVADLFTTTLRSTDLVGRYGGDEFVIMLLNNDLDSGQKIKEKIQAVFSDLRGYEFKISQWLNKPVLIPEKEWLNVSIGISFYDLHAEKTLDDLLKEADRHMYEDKRKRKLALKE